ncbi:hypothetical protein HCUR_00383 [Holospora curviuscula]|uniref:Uncharacterized protein n=1 Tax=Holospora curviuscula TaxID=1082868 RepID=A0A2S5RAH4_9PROT|nr:hypothetical protein HCUR_00383 [Holospora curviuscula]
MKQGLVHCIALSNFTLDLSFNISQKLFYCVNQENRGGLPCIQCFRCILSYFGDVWDDEESLITPWGIFSLYN